MLAESESVKTVLISGEEDLCKAFLFETAVTYAKDGRTVYYFASKPFHSMPKIFHDRSEPSADALKLMTFFYVRSYEGLITQLTQLQTFQKIPSIILIDDLNEFVCNAQLDGGTSRILHAARCCAVILNAAYSCAQVVGKTVQVCAANFPRVAAASEKDDERTLKRTYDKYFDNRWTYRMDEQDRRKAWLRSEDGKVSMEYRRLDDDALALWRVFEKVVERVGEESSLMETS